MTALLLALGWVSVVSPAALAAGPTTFANATALDIPASGSASQEGPASPYPSTIAVSNMTGVVTTVTLTLHDLTHGSVGDIDAMLVAPSGENLVFLSDIGDPGPGNPITQLVLANDIDLTFADSAASSVPRQLHLETDTYKPTNTDTGQPDTFPGSAPAPSDQTTLGGAFTGIDPNGTWSLYMVDDNSGDVGNLAGGWSLSITTEVAAVATQTAVATSGTPSTTTDPVTFTATVTSGGNPVTAGTVKFSDSGTDLGSAVAVNGSGKASLTTSALTEGTHQIVATYSGATGFLASNDSVRQRVDNRTVVTNNTFCNTGPLTVPSVGTASPYPSHIDVSGLSGKITKVTATLKGLSHSSPIDLDVLLSGPTPSENLFLLSDSGGHNPVTDADVIFDDDAAGGVPDPLASGTLRPTNSDDGSNDAMTGPAPTPSSATALSTFDGGSANGQWSLWVVDDASGDSGEISGGWCLTVTAQSATTTALTASPNPAAFGADVTLTAKVSAGSSPVTAGSVQFSDGGTALGAPVSVAADGTAKLTTADLTVGTHKITAAYTGTADFADSSDSLDQVVTAVGTKTDLASDNNPSVDGQSVKFTATVTKAGDPVATGTVKFTDGQTSLATVPVGADGTASVSTSALDVGTHKVKATFSGTSSLATSNDSIDQVVNRPQAPTTSVLASDQNPSNLGQSVTFTATVTSGPDPVTDGSVTFRIDGNTVAAAVDHDTGKATYSTATLSVGKHSVSATFTGTDAYRTSASNTVDQTVRLVADAGGPYTVSEGNSVTLDASGSSPGVSYAWDVNGDGDFGDASGSSPKLSWADLETLGIDDGPSTHKVAVRVSDNGHSLDSATTTLTVDNTAPTSVITGDLSATVGVPFTVKVGAHDPSSADMAAGFSYTIDWGDDSPVETLTGPADPPVTHTYTDSGAMSLSVTATDKDGSVGAPTAAQVQVAAASSPTPTSSGSPSGSPTASSSGSPTASSSGSPTASSSGSPTASSSGSPTASSSGSPTASSSGSPTATSSPSGSPTATSSGSPSATSSPSSSPTATSSESPTPTSSGSPSATSSGSPSATSSPSGSPTPTSSGSPSATSSGTSSATGGPQSPSSSPSGSAGPGTAAPGGGSPGLPPSTGGILPNTGSDIGLGLLGLAAGLLVAGGTLLFIARRRAAGTRTR